jgi:hypothetical protein
MERAMAVDDAASALKSLRDVRSCTEGVGIESGVSVSSFGLRRRRIARADSRINSDLNDELEIAEYPLWLPGSPR